MGEYINKYANSAAIQSAVDGGELIKPYVALDESTGLIDWNSKTSLKDMPLTFEITGDGDIKWLAIDFGSLNAKTIEYSKNGGEWTSITSTTEGVTIPVVSGDTIQFRGDNAVYGDENFNYNSFNGSTAQFKIKGNIMSLIDSTNFSGLTTLQSAYTFALIFQYCTGLTDVSNLILPATTLTQSCYLGMFMSCTSLTTAPVLPATTLVYGCYGSMFQGCTSLTTTPSLPATTLAENCYNGMFNNCSGLTTAPELPVTTLAENCYNGMFLNCTSLTTAPELPATTLAQSCYANMFWGCTSLTQAPELPATTLAQECYYWMFSGCTNLNYIKCLATDISASGCTGDWVNGVASTGTFVKAASMSDWTTGNDGIPEGWTVEEE